MIDNKNNLKCRLVTVILPKHYFESISWSAMPRILERTYTRIISHGLPTLVRGYKCEGLGCLHIHKGDRKSIKIPIYIYSVRETTFDQNV